jgi:PAS domain S-box-containing protein
MPWPKWLTRRGKTPRPTPFQTNLISVLRAAAGVARRATSTEADVLRAVSEELRQLKLIGGVLLLDDQGQLVVRNRVISPVVELTLRRLTGLEIVGYRFDPGQVPTIKAALDQGEPVFLSNRRAAIEQILPDGLGPVTPAIIRLIGGETPSIIAPLMVSDSPLGVITVNAPWLTPDDLPLVTSLADHVAIALSHVRSREEMRGALSRERLRNQVAEAVASSFDLSTILERVIKIAVTVSGADAGAFALIDSDGDAIHYPYTFGLPEEVALAPSPRGTGVAWDLVERGEPVLLEEYGSHLNALAHWAGIGLHAFLGVPLYAGEEPVGALGLTKPGELFRQDQVDMTQAIANMASVAIKNASLYDEIRRRVDESQALIQTSRSISGSLDLETVLRMIAEQAMELFRADGSRIHMLDPQRGILRCLVAIDPQAESMLALELEPGEGLIGHVMDTGKPMVFNDPSTDPRSRQVPGTPSDEAECLAMAPLLTRQRTVGVMAVRRLGIDQPFTSSDVELLTAFAAQAAVAIENADLYGQIESQAQRLEGEVVERTRDLALSEARFRGLLETSLAGIAQIDAQGSLTYVNRVFSNLVNVPEAELQGMNIHQAALRIFPPHLRQVMIDRLKPGAAFTLPSRETYEVEISGERPGSVPAIFAVNRILDEDGQPQGTTVLMLDISERKALETALRSERDRLDTILSSIGDAVLVTDPDGVVEYANPAWQRLSGYAQPEDVDGGASLANEELNPGTVVQEMWETLKSAKAWHGELINRRKDGRTYEVAASITPVLSDDKTVVNFVAVQHDISALKELDRLKSQFVSDVSHELRTPLTNIRLYVDLLRETHDAERSSTYIETLTRESERLAHLIDDLLSLSRLESGSTPFEPRPVDLNGLLQALYNDRRALAASKGLILLMESSPELPTAMGDERLLTQVFTNLLTNAMNYTPSGGRITLKTDATATSEQDWIMAVFEDTGIGIATEERPRIFDRFFRGKASLSTGAPGTGLGLAICKEIAEIHGGRIQVESNDGRGTRVTVWLPSVSQANPAT